MALTAKPSALDVTGKMPALFESRVTVPAHCVFCGRIRRVLADSWMCIRCRRKSMWELFPKLLALEGTGALWGWPDSEAEVETRGEA